MEDKSLIKKYENFLKLNHLNISFESASDFIDLEEGPTLMELSMEYVKRGSLMRTKTTKIKYYHNALIIYKDNFAAKIAIVEANGFNVLDYEDILDKEYDRLLNLDYLESKYYPNGTIDFSKYQETFNYLRGLRSYYITLVAKEDYDKAISIGNRILELNPCDHYHIKSSLCFLYLKLKDLMFIEDLFNDTSIIVGTKELAHSYMAYLNKDINKSLEYLSDLEAVNPYLYRLVTGEVRLPENMQIESTYSDSIYVYLSFVTLGKDLEGYEEIVNKSKNEHFILKSLTKDEIDVLTVAVFENITYIHIDFIKKAAKNYHLVDYVSNFSDGRMESILIALTSRGIIKDNRITLYGIFVKDYLEEYLIKEAKRIKDEALELYKNNLDHQAEEKLMLSMDYSPHDFFLKKLYLFHKEPFDYHYARNLIHEMGLTYKEYDNNNYGNIHFRGMLEDAMDEIHYMYYKNAYQDGGLNGLIEAYTKLENQFVKYTNLIQMAQYLNHDLLPLDSIHSFYALYKEYIEKNTLSYDKIIYILKKSKLEYALYKKGINRIPYQILDEKFYRAYLGVLDVISLDELLSIEEMDVLISIAQGKIDDMKSSYTFLINAKALEKSFFLKSRNHKDEYELEEFVKEYLTKFKKI